LQAAKQHEMHPTSHFSKQSCKSIMKTVSILFLPLLAFASAHQTTVRGNKDSFQKALKRSTYKLPGNRYPKSPSRRCGCSTMQVQLHRENGYSKWILYINVDDIKKKARRLGKKKAKRLRKKETKASWQETRGQRQAR
jgi:hypothetical protein